MKIRLLCVAVIIGTMLSACSPGASDSSSTSDTPSPLEPDSNASLMTRIDKIPCYYEDLEESAFKGDVLGWEAYFWNVFQHAQRQEVDGLLEELKDALKPYLKPGTPENTPEPGDLSDKEKCAYALLTGRIGFVYTWLYAESAYFTVNFAPPQWNYEALESAYNYLSAANLENKSLNWEVNSLEHARLFAFAAVVQGFTTGTAAQMAAEKRPIPNTTFQNVHKFVEELGNEAFMDHGWFNFAGGIFFETLRGEFNFKSNPHLNSEVNIWKIMVAGTDSNLPDEVTKHYKWITNGKAYKGQVPSASKKLGPWWVDKKPPAAFVRYVFDDTDIVPGNVEDNFLVLGDVTFIKNFASLNSAKSVPDWLDLAVAAYTYSTDEIKSNLDYTTWVSHKQLDRRITCINRIKTLLDPFTQGNEAEITTATNTLRQIIQDPWQRYPTCMTCHENRFQPSEFPDFGGVDRPTGSPTLQCE